MLAQILLIYISIGVIVAFYLQQKKYIIPPPEGSLKSFILDNIIAIFFWPISLSLRFMLRKPPRIEFNSYDIDENNEIHVTFVHEKERFCLHMEDNNFQMMFAAWCIMKLHKECKDSMEINLDDFKIHIHLSKKN